MKVIYADDEAYSLELVKEFLEESGDITVDTAISARKALDKLAERRYDAIISDYGMPGMDGIEFLRTVREKDLHIPFILFTGRGREEVAVEALNAGATFYVRKGADIEAQFAEMTHKIRQGVARRETENELQTRRLQAGMALDLAGIATWKFDHQTGLFEFDDIFYRLCGTDAEHENGYRWTPEEYIRGFVHPDDANRVAKFMTQGFRDAPPGTHLKMKHRLVRRDGAVRELLVVVDRTVDAHGNDLLVVGVSQDITGR